MNGKCRGRLGRILLSAALFAPGTSLAQIYHWHGTDGVEGGSGVWGMSNVPVQVGWKRNNTGALVAWPVSAASAVFSGSLQNGNTVHIREDVSVSSMLFTSGVSAGGAYTLRQDAASADIVLSNNATITSHNRDAIVSAPLISSGGFVFTQLANSTYGKLQLENPAGTNLFGGEITVVGCSTAFGTLLRVQDDNQLNSATAPSGKVTVILQGGAQFGSSSAAETTTISSPVRVGNALAGQLYGGALVGSYEATNLNTTYSGGLAGTGGTGSLLIRPVDNHHTITLAGAGTFDRPIVLYNNYNGTEPRNTTLIVTASGALGAGKNRSEAAWTDIGIGNRLRFARGGEWTYLEEELLALRASNGAIGSAVEVTTGNLTFNGGLALVRGAGLNGAEGRGAGGIPSTRFPSLHLASGTSMHLVGGIRDSGTGTAIGWRKTGAGTLTLPHSSTFAEQQFTYGGELHVPYIDRTSQPLGASGDGTNFKDDTASLWVKYDRQGFAEGSTIRFFNDLLTQSLIVRDNNESLLIAGVGVLDASDGDGRRKGTIEIGPNLDITQAGGGALRVWHLTESEYARPGNVANIDAFVRVASSSTYRVNSIQTVWQSNLGDDDGYLDGGRPNTFGEVNTVFGGGGTVHINGVQANTVASYRLNMLAADATTLITDGVSGTAAVYERGFGFIGDHAAFGAAGQYVSPVLQVTKGHPTAFASAITLRKVDNGDTLSAVINTPFLDTAESAKVDGDIANVTPGHVALTKSGSGRLVVRRILLNDGDKASGDLCLVGGALQMQGGDGPSRVRNLTIRGARLEMVPGTSMIIDGSETTLADVRRAVVSGWNSGTWGGPGIALVEPSDPWRIGYAVAGEIGLGDSVLFGDSGGLSSRQYVVEPKSLLVRTVCGADTDLDGAVNFDDLLKLAQNYGLLGKVWSDGELTYSPNGVINSEDLLLLAQTYGHANEPVQSGIPGDLMVFLELRAGAPWVLEDVLSSPEGLVQFGAYLDDGSMLGRGYVTRLQGYALTNHLVPEPSSLAVLSLLAILRRRR